jgi:hypothetical protein
MSDSYAEETRMPKSNLKSNKVEAIKANRQSLAAGPVRHHTGDAVNAEPTLEEGLQ